MLDSVTRRVNDLERTPQLARSAIMNGALRAYEGSRLTMVMGRQYDGTNAAIPVTGPTPPTPHIPTVVPRPGGIAVAWDGTFADAQGTQQTRSVAPMDFARVDVVVSDDTIPDWIATLPSHSFTSPRGGEIFIALPEGNYRVVLITRSLPGVPSAPSQSQEVTAAAVVEPSDGIEPQTPPDVTAVGGLGAVLVRLREPVANKDPVLYEYHASPVPFTAVPNDAGTIVHVGPETSVTVRAYANGDPIGPTEQGVLPSPVYLRVFAKDDDGWSPQSQQVMAVPVLVTSADIAANQGWFGYLQAVDFRSGTISGDVGLFGRLATLGAGENVGQGWEAGARGARWFNPQGKVVVDIPYNLSDTNPATFTGKGIFQQLEASAGMTMRGTSQIVQGAELVLANQQAPPSLAPTAGVDLEAVSLDFAAAYAAVTGGQAATRILGMQYDTAGAEWWVGVYLSPFVRVLRFDPTTGAYKGQQIAIDTSVNWIGGLNPQHWAHTSGAKPRHVLATTTWVYFYTDAGALAGEPEMLLNAPTDIVKPSLSPDGANFLVADLDSSDSTLRTRSYSPDNAAGANVAVQHVAGQQGTFTVAKPPTAIVNVSSGSEPTVGPDVVNYSMTSNTGATVYLRSPLVTISPSRQYTASVVTYATGNGADMLTTGVMIEWIAADGVTIISSNQKTRTGSARVTSTVTALAPAGAVSARLAYIITDRTNSARGYYYSPTLQTSAGWNVTNLWRATKVAGDVWTPPGLAATSTSASGAVRRTDSDMANVERIVFGPTRAAPDGVVVPYRTSDGTSGGHTWRGPQSVAAEAFTFANGNYFVLASGRVYKFGTATWDDTTTSSDWQAAYSWRDTNANNGVHETGLSPFTRFTMRKRHRVTLTTGPVPGGSGDDVVNAVGFYVGREVEATPLVVDSVGATGAVGSLTTTTPHGLVVGDTVKVTGGGAQPGATFYGTYTVTAVPGTTKFTYALSRSALATTTVTDMSARKVTYPDRTGMAYQGDMAVPQTVSAAGVLTNPNPAAATAANTITNLTYGPDPAGTYAFPNASPGRVVSAKKRASTSQLPVFGVDGDGNGRWDDVSPLGAIVLFGGIVIPTNWRKCEAQAMSMALYPDVYAALGGASSPWGVDLANGLFYLPDLRGRSPIGVGSVSPAQANNVYALGQKYGDERPQAHSHTGSTGGQSADHTHTMGIFSSGNEAAGYGLVANGGFVNRVMVTGGGTATGGASGNHFHDFSTSTSGAGASGNVHPVAGVYYIIKII
jgi:microcystin-dependent protein